MCCCFKAGLIYKQLNLFESFSCVVDVSVHCCGHLCFQISEVLSQWSRGAYFVSKYMKNIRLFQKVDKQFPK